jgi:hypothetical protein
MKIPSIRQVVESSTRTFFRFPAVLISAMVGTVIAVILADHEGPPSPTILYGVLLAAILGIPFFTALTLTAEKKKWGRTSLAAGTAVAAVLLACYAITVPANLPDAPGFHMIRFALLAAALHFLVAVAPFMGGGETNGFWQYNKEVALRFITAFLFSLVLHAGLSIALAALDNLFGIDVPGRRYFELWISISGIFTTWFFLAGVPPDLDTLDASDDYPGVVRIFGQYILFPLMGVYLLILYAYIGKILVEWSWPRGWVSGLILGYGTAGMLLFLLLHPVRGRPENVWMKSASRWFYVSMVPLVVVLFLAMYRRIAEYGITEGRYLGMLLAAWFAVMVAYFLLSRGKNIRAIPASLCLVGLLAGFGPWGAFEVSESSQVVRLRDLLEKNSILEGGKIVKARGPVPGDDQGEISSILEYLHRNHGYAGIQPWFDESLEEDISLTKTGIKPPILVAGMMGIDYSPGRSGGRDGSITLNIERAAVADVAGYDRMIPSQVIGSMNRGRVYPSEEIAFRASPRLDTLILISTPAGGTADSISIALRPLVDDLLETYGDGYASDIPAAKMTLQQANGRLSVKILLRQLQLRRRDGAVTMNSYEAAILYSVVSIR